MVVHSIIDALIAQLVERQFRKLEVVGSIPTQGSMELVLAFEAKDLQKVKDVLLKDDVISRASLTFKEGSIIGKQVYYCYLSGTDEQCKKAIELSKSLAKEVKGREKEDLIAKIKEEERKASEGMGSIFG